MVAQVLGLGKAPADVTFTSPKGVYSEECDYTIGGALSTFWRSAENFRTQAGAQLARFMYFRSSSSLISSIFLILLFFFI
jgi:hypothetical protein